MILTLTYGSNNGTVSTDFEVKSYNKKTIYYNNLKHAENSVSLSIPYNENIQNIINVYSSGDIKAQITDNSSTVFTGYLRKDFSFSKKQRNQPMSLEIVSPDYTLDVDSSTIHAERSSSLGKIVTYLLNQTSFDGNYNVSSLNSIIIPLFIINEGDNIKTVLDKLLTEYGYQYDFDTNGNFTVYPLFSDVPSDMSTITSVFNGDNCIDEIKINKKEQEHNGTKVTYSPTSLKSNIIVFADTTNGDAGKLSCNIELPAKSYLGNLDDGTTTYYIEYDSTAGEVKWAEDVSLTIESSNNAGLVTTFTNHGLRGEISVYNKTNSTITITKIQVKGSAYVSNETAISTSSKGTKFYEYSAEYIQNSTYADSLARNYTNWESYADYTIDLKSRTNWPLGTFVKVEEVGLATMYGRIIEKTEKIDGSPIQYKIEAISEYSQSAATTRKRQNAIFTTIGLKGDKGDAGEQGPQGETGPQGPQGIKGDTGTRGNLTFEGTEIYNIRASAVAYTLTTESTGITSNSMSILVGDKYINSLTFDVWKCTTAGTASTAKWTYEGRQGKDSDSSNQWRFFGNGTRNKYNGGNFSKDITVTTEVGESPFGGNSELLKIERAASTDTSRDYVTPFNKTVKIESGFSYRYVCYVKKTTANVRSYFGIQNWKDNDNGYNPYVLSLSGGYIYNAYCCDSTNFGTLNRWYCIVSYVTANGVKTAPANDAGVYDMVTKQKVLDCVNYQFKNITEVPHEGTMILYNWGKPAPADTAYIYDIRFDKLDGTEPTLYELLNIDTNAKGKGNWNSGTNYIIGDSVFYSTNGCSYICKSSHTSSSSIVPTNTTYWDKLADKGAKGDRGFSSRTIAFRANYSEFATANAGECYTCGYDSNGAEADTPGYVIVNGQTYYAKGMTNTGCAEDGYLIIPTTATSSSAAAVPVVAYDTGLASNPWYYIKNGVYSGSDYTVSITDANKPNWVVIAKMKQYDAEGNVSIEPVTPCLLSAVSQPLDYYYEGIVAAVTQYTSANITPYKITESSGTFSKTALTARNAKRGAVVINTNAVTPTSSTAQAKFQYYNGTYWRDIDSSDPRYYKFIELAAGDLPALAGYYDTLGLSVPTICGTYINTLTSNRAFIDKLFANVITVGREVKSSNYVAASSTTVGDGFRLSSDGSAYINKLDMNGYDLKADTNNNLIFAKNYNNSNINNSNNTLIGYNIGDSKTCGCIIIGSNSQNRSSFNNNDNGDTNSDNIIIGDNCLKNLDGGYYMVAIGNGCLTNFTHGVDTGNWSCNTAIGYNALHNLTTGTGNTAIGPFTCRDYTTGCDNMEIGYATAHKELVRSFGMEKWCNVIMIGDALTYITLYKAITQDRAFKIIVNCCGKLIKATDWSPTPQNIPAMGFVGNAKKGENRSIDQIYFGGSNYLQLQNTNETNYMTINNNSTSPIGQNVVLFIVSVGKYGARVESTNV